MKKTQGAQAKPDERIRAPRGPTLSCKGWAQEAALRMLMNSLDPEVAERPEEALFQGGNRLAEDSGRSTPGWDCFRAIVASLRELENDQTLLVHFGRPVAIFHTRPEAPRVVLANAFSSWQLAAEPGAHSNVSSGNACGGDISSGEPFTADSWMYVGTQSTLQNAFDLFGSLAQRHFGGSLAGRLVAVCGLGTRGGAQPLAAALHGAAVLGIDVDAERIKRRVKTGYCDVMVNDLDEALRILKNAVRRRVGTSVGLIGNCAALVPELARRGVLPDVVMNMVGMKAAPAGDGDFAAAGDSLAYIPQNFTVAQAADLLQRDADAYRQQALDSFAEHVRGLLALQRLGALVHDCADAFRALGHHFQNDHHGVREAFEIPGVTSARSAPGELANEPAWLPDGPSLTRDNGVAITCVALSGEPGDIARVDRLLLEICPGDADLQRWIPLVKKHVRFQGLPARSCRLPFAKVGELMSAVNDLVARGELKAPVVIAENDVASACANSHLRGTGESRFPAGGGESANLDTSSHAGSDTAAGSVIGAVLESEGSAAWISVRSVKGGSDINGGRTEEDRTLRACRAMVADGTRETAARLEREWRSTGSDALPPVAPYRFADHAAAAGLLRERLVRVVMP
jgi:urocanate hydratase